MITFISSICVGTFSNLQVLDCYDAYLEGLCVASYANCYKGCFNAVTGRKAVPNARISYSSQHMSISLRVGVNSPDHLKSPKNFWIQANTEIIIDYGDMFFKRNFN
jgi:hypothetical protein